MICVILIQEGLLLFLKTFTRWVIEKHLHKMMICGIMYCSILVYMYVYVWMRVNERISGTTKTCPHVPESMNPIFSHNCLKCDT